MRNWWLYPVIFLFISILFFADVAGAVTVNIFSQTVAPPPFQVVQAVPYNGQVVASSEYLLLRFNQPIKMDRSDVKLISAYGHVVAHQGIISADGVSMQLQFAALPPGRYSVKWRAECRCAGDVALQDTYRFTVAPSAGR